MTVGCLGDVEFSVSSELVQTFENMKWQGSARIASHDRHLGGSLAEFTGSDAEKVSFDFVLSEFLGMTGVQQALDKLRLYMENGRILPLVIGTKSYGRYRWLIQSLETSKNVFDGRGKLLSCHVAVSLIEYLKR